MQTATPPSTAHRKKTLMTNWSHGVDRIVRVTHKTDDLLTASCVMDRHTQQGILDTGQYIACHTPRRLLDMAHFKEESRDIIQAGVPEARRRPQRTPTTNQNQQNNDLRRDATWLITGARWLERLKQPTRPTTAITATTTTQPTTHERTAHTTEAHD